MSKEHNNISVKHMYQNNNLCSNIFFFSLSAIKTWPQINNKDRNWIKANKKARWWGYSFLRLHINWWRRILLRAQVWILLLRYPTILNTQHISFDTGKKSQQSGPRRCCSRNSSGMPSNGRTSWAPITSTYIQIKHIILPI